MEMIHTRKRIFSGISVILFRGILFTVTAAFLFSCLSGCGEKEVPPVRSSSSKAQAGTNNKSGTAPLPSIAPGKGKVLSVKNIQQNPELQAGCEVTSAAIVLNYLGFSINKTDLLPFLSVSNDFRTVSGKTYGPNPWKTFVGSPTGDRYGCYAPVISNAVNNYLISAKANRFAYDITGTSASDLYSLIGEGVPVIVWVTIGMREPSLGPGWFLDDNGEYYQWINREHTVVLIGYTDSQVILSDPDDSRGTVLYSRALFEQRYESLLSQAVVIQ